MHTIYIVFELWMKELISERCISDYTTQEATVQKKTQLEQDSNP